MSFIFNDGTGTTCSLPATNNGALMFRLYTLLKAAGWVHVASSDGTNVSNTAGNANDQIGNATEAATNNAWWFGMQPGGRIFGFRRGATDQSWLVVYVPLDTAGAAQPITTPGTTTAVPLFTTRFALVGTLPDTTAQWFAGSTHRWTMGADSSPPYGVQMFGLSVTGGLASGSGGFTIDPLEPGSYDYRDQDPYVLYAPVSTNNTSWTVLGAGGGFGFDSSTDAPWCYYRKGLNGESFSRVGAVQPFVASTSLVRLISRSPYDPSVEQAFPIIYAKRNNTASPQLGFIKGWSSLMRWQAQRVPGGFLGKRLVANDRITVGDTTQWWDPTQSPVY